MKTSVGKTEIVTGHVVVIGCARFIGLHLANGRWSRGTPWSTSTP